MEPGKFLGDQYHRRYQIGMEQTQQLSELQNGESSHP